MSQPRSEEVTPEEKLEMSEYTLLVYRLKYFLERFEFRYENEKV